MVFEASLHYLCCIQRLSMETTGTQDKPCFSPAAIVLSLVFITEDSPISLYSFYFRSLVNAATVNMSGGQCALHDPETAPNINYSIGTGCVKCADVCPAESLLMSAKHYSVKDIMQIVLRDRPYYDRSQGGVTLSGGEPLAQDVGALEALMKEIKKEKINLSIDTSGAIPRLNLETALKYADSFLYDLKHLDPIKHKEFTKSDNRQILDNLIWLSKQDTVIHLRIPVILLHGEKEEWRRWLTGSQGISLLRRSPFALPSFWQKKIRSNGS